jgi:hypothetical protein
MKSLAKLFIVFLSSLVIYSCTVHEKFHFNKDYSGHYSFEFDYSELASFDTSSAMQSEMGESFYELERELKKIEGLDNILIVTDAEKGVVMVSYDFENLEALNKANYNQENESYDKLFSLDGKKLLFTTDFSDEIQEYKESDMNEDEILENIESLLDYTITFTFDRKVKVIKQTNIEQSDNHTLVFKLTSESGKGPSSFLIKSK